MLQVIVTGSLTILKLYKCVALLRTQGHLKSQCTGVYRWFIEIPTPHWMGTQQTMQNKTNFCLFLIEYISKDTVRVQFTVPKRTTMMMGAVVFKLISLSWEKIGQELRLQIGF